MLWKTVSSNSRLYGLVVKGLKHVKLVMVLLGKIHPTVLWYNDWKDVEWGELGSQRGWRGEDWFVYRKPEGWHGSLSFSLHKCRSQTRATLCPYGNKCVYEWMHGRVYACCSSVNINLPHRPLSHGKCSVSEVSGDRGQYTDVPILLGLC